MIQNVRVNELALDFDFSPGIGIGILNLLCWFSLQPPSIWIAFVCHYFDALPCGGEIGELVVFLPWLEQGVQKRQLYAVYSTERRTSIYFFLCIKSDKRGKEVAPPSRKVYRIELQVWTE
ncbi:hypothetical protein SUGI_0334460 [Cryptomeria japonica]|nr:hypothetical protein SUGI_0334460 [Cryptomeria japonica]